MCRKDKVQTIFDHLQKNLHILEDEDAIKVTIRQALSEIETKEADEEFSQLDESCEQIVTDMAYPPECYEAFHGYMA